MSLIKRRNVISNNFLKFCFTNTDYSPTLSFLSTLFHCRKSKPVPLTFWAVFVTLVWQLENFSESYPQPLLIGSLSAAPNAVPLVASTQILVATR